MSPSIATPAATPAWGPARRSAIGPPRRLLSADLANEAATQALLPEAAAALGPIGVLVNNASPFERDEWHDATRASWDAHIEPGLRAPFVLMQHFARALPADAEGVVINMLDQRVWSITPHFVSYTVAKAGLWALTQSMALALAPRIRVNGIGPGPALPSPRQTPEQFARQSASVPLRPRHQPRRDRPRGARNPCPAGDDGPDAGTRRRPAPAMAARPPRRRRPRSDAHGSATDRQQRPGAAPRVPARPRA